MKYQKEAEEALQLYTSMIERDYPDPEDRETMLWALRDGGITIESLHREIEQGVANGYTVEIQMEILREICATVKADQHFKSNATKVAIKVLARNNIPLAYKVTK